MVSLLYIKKKVAAFIMYLGCNFHVSQILEDDSLFSYEGDLPSFEDQLHLFVACLKNVHGAIVLLSPALASASTRVKFLLKF